MSKHDRAWQEKIARNEIYKQKFQQRKCEDCGHKSCKPGRCRICRGIMKAKGR